MVSPNKVQSFLRVSVNFLSLLIYYIALYLSFYNRLFVFQETLINESFCATSGDLRVYGEVNRFTAKLQAVSSIIR